MKIEIESPRLVLHSPDGCEATLEELEQLVLVLGLIRRLSYRIEHERTSSHCSQTILLECLPGLFKLQCIDDAHAR